MNADQPKPKTALEYLDGMPPMMMMVVEARLKERIRRELGLPVDNDPSMPCMSYGKGYLFVFEDGVDGVARWILHRMMTKRINDGRQFDSILECSRRAFATAMFAQQLGALKD